MGKNSHGLTGLVARIGPRKIRTKIFLLFTLLMVAMSAFLAAYLPGLLNRQLTSEAGRRIETLSGMMALEASSGLVAEDPKVLQSGLQKMCDLSDEILYAVLETGSGQALAAVNPDLADKMNFRQAARAGTGLDLGRPVRLKIPVVSGDRETEVLFLGLSFESLYASVRSDRKVIIIGSLATLVVGVLFIFLVSSQITRPLAHLSWAADRIGRGDLKQRAKISSRDEIGLLAEAFNGMVDGFENAYHDLQNTTRSIKDSVSSKSLDLEKEVNERLRIEREYRLATSEIENRVTQRTEELSKVNDELHGKMLETRRAEDQLQTNLERLEIALEGTIRAISQTLEIRDLNTAGHQRRVSNLAVAIAREMHLPSDRIRGIRLAGIIHDIGKIAVPLEILTKPMRLTKTETQLVNDHPKTGYDILKSIDFPWPIAHIILQHHERLDGSGYPEGLVGDAILLEARILAVADVVEASASQRPYRAALGLDKAIDEIQKWRGTRYDTRAVDACVKLFREKRFSLQSEGEGGLSN